MANEEQKVNETTEATEATAATMEQEKTGFWKKLGKGVKIGIIAGGTLLAAGATWFVVHLLGSGNEDGEDSEEPVGNIGAGEDIPADE